MNPLIRHTAWHVPRPLDLPAMRARRAVLRGQARLPVLRRQPRLCRESPPSARCRAATSSGSGRLLTFIIEGDGFLYKMCRGIVGTLVQVGLGKFPPEEVEAMLAQKDRRVAGMTAPAHGLVLWKVFYRKTVSLMQRSSWLNRKSRRTRATWRGLRRHPNTACT